MHNPESVLENERHKLLWDFEIQTSHLLSSQTTRPYNNHQKKKENLSNCGQSKIERKRKEVPGPCKRIEKTYRI